MAGGGRIRDEDVVLVRQRSSIDSVVGDYTALKPAGGGRMKGLCPFHDEKTPSFYVTTDLGYYKCFGCGEGGDVISFVQAKEQLSFVESIEWLAKRAGISLTYEQAGSAVRSAGSQRQRLVAAHAEAAAYYAQQLAGPEAQPAREFLAARGFDQQSAIDYALGYAPKGWDNLLNHLLGKGFKREELTTAGLVKQSSRGTLIDSWRGRLVWPIRDVTGEVVGFNARKLYDDDPGPKYLNSPETPIFKKSAVLYGLDKAKTEIHKRHQAVVVEGVADVLACHLAGVPTAVAALGTAFGEEHVKQLRRMLMDQDELRGEVIFLFDGDAAGQKAAIKAFVEDQRFVTQTFVAVEPGGQDPCELRLSKGDAAVRDLVARRVPLFEFVIRTALERYDLSTPEGRTQALNASAPMVAGIKDLALRPQYSVRLAGWLGLDESIVVDKVNELTGADRARRRTPAPRVERPADDPVRQVERELLKIALQRPALAGPAFDVLEPELFVVDGHRAVREALRDAGGTALGITGGEWVAAVLEACPDDEVRSLVLALTAEGFHNGTEEDVTPAYVEAHVARVQELGATRRIQELKSRLQRLNPLEAAEDYNRLFGDLIALEQFKRHQQQRAVGVI